MKVCIAGSSGFIGSALRSAFQQHGWTVSGLGRGVQDNSRGFFSWNPSAGSFDSRALEGVNAVINLAGKSIDSPWTERNKAEMLESRVQSTALLANHIAQLATPPAFISASAVGFYGDRGAEVLTENTGPGSGFLAGLCSAWENAAQPAAAQGGRLVVLRLGVVLSASGGALKKLLPVFRLGAGAVLGDGKQYMSWIALPDLIEIIRFCVEDSACTGLFNATAPHPSTNLDFSTKLAACCGSKARFAVPALVLRTMLREKARELLLSSQRAVPAALEARGFRFRYPDISVALSALLTS